MASKRKKAGLTKQQRAWVEHARNAISGKDPEARRRFLRGFRHGTQEPENEGFRTAMDALANEGR